MVGMDGKNSTSTGSIIHQHGSDHLSRSVNPPFWPSILLYHMPFGTVSRHGGKDRQTEQKSALRLCSSKIVA